VSATNIHYIASKFSRFPLVPYEHSTGIVPGNLFRNNAFYSNAMKEMGIDFVAIALCFTDQGRG
jgi:hypothetical protein